MDMVETVTQKPNGPKVWTVNTTLHISVIIGLMTAIVSGAYFAGGLNNNVTSISNDVTATSIVTAAHAAQITELRMEAAARGEAIIAMGDRLARIENKLDRVINDERRP
jgi:hypothetical protein